MAVRLDINVRGVKGLGGRGGGASPAAMQRQVAQIQKIQERSELKLQKLREQMQRRNELAVIAMNRKEQRIKEQGLRRHEQRRLKSLQLYNRGVDRFRQRMQRQRAAEERAHARLRLAQERTVQRRKLRNIARLKRAMRGLARGAGRGAGSIAGGIGGAGAGIGGALGALTSGGGGLGGLARGVGGAGASLVGGAGSLAGGVAGAIPGIGGIAKGIVGGITSAASGVIQAAGNLAGMFVDKFVAIVKMGLVAGLAIAFVSINKAMKFEAIEDSFKGLIRTWGTDAPAALDAFRLAAKGTVSDLDLLTAANNALLLNSVDSVPQFGKLIEAGRRLGKAMGRTAAEGLSDLTIGIGRQSRLVLDNLGIIVRTEAAYQTYAESLGKTVSAMSEAEKRAAFLAAAMKGIDDRLGKLGPETQTFTDIWNQFKTEIENTAVAIGQIFLPVLKELLPKLKKIVTGIKDWLSANSVNLAEKLSSAMSGIVKWLGKVGDFIEGNGLADFFRQATDWAAKFFEYIRKQMRAMVSEISGEIKALMLEAQGASEGGILSQVAGHAADVVTMFGSTDYSEQAESIKPMYQRRAEQARLHGGRMAGHMRRQASEMDLSWTGNMGAGGGGGGVAGGGPVPVQIVGAGGMGDPGRAARVQAHRAQSGIVDPGIVQPGAPKFFPPGADAKTTAVSTAKFDTAEADAVSARMRSIVDSLKSVGVEFEGLPKALQEMLEKASTSEEATADLRQAAEQKAAQIHKQAIVDASKATVDSLKTAKEKQEEMAEAAKKTFDEMAAKFKELGESLKTKLAEIDAALETEFDSIQSAALQRTSQVFAQVDAKAQGLAGIAGGMGAKGGLPLNVRKAIQKVSKGRTRRRKDELRRATAGMSSDDLAANDGAMLQQVLQDQAGREAGARGQLAAILQETNAMFADAEAKSLEEQEAVKVAAEEAKEAVTAKLDAEAETLKATAEALKGIDERMKKAEADLASVNKAIALVGGK